MIITKEVSSEQLRTDYYYYKANAFEYELINADFFTQQMLIMVEMVNLQLMRMTRVVMIYDRLIRCKQLQTVSAL